MENQQEARRNFLKCLGISLGAALSGATVRISFGQVSDRLTAQKYAEHFADLKAGKLTVARALRTMSPADQFAFVAVQEVGKSDTEMRALVRLLNSTKVGNELIQKAIGQGCGLGCGGSKAGIGQGCGAGCGNATKAPIFDKAGNAQLNRAAFAQVKQADVVEAMQRAAEGYRKAGIK